MQRRDRILSTINHIEPDRVPISFDASVEHKQRLLAHYKVNSFTDLYAKTEIDCFSVWDWPAVLPKYKGPRRRGVTVYDSTYGCWGKVGERIYPLAEQAIDDFLWPDIDHFDFSHVKEDLLAVRKRDMTTTSGHAGVGWLHHVQMRGYTHALYDVLNDVWMEEYMAYNRRFILPYFERLFACANGLIDIVRADEDLGGHENMLISPDLWRKWYKPLWQDVFDICHKNGAIVWMHSCGFCRSVLDDFLEMGVNVLNPLPPYVRGSDPEDMKQTYGHRLAFDGGVDQLRVLVQGTPEMVEEETRLRLKQLSPGGGYILGPSQVITNDIPFENVVVMIETALKYGRY